MANNSTTNIALPPRSPSARLSFSDLPAELVELALSFVDVKNPCELASLERCCKFMYAQVNYFEAPINSSSTSDAAASEDAEILSTTTTTTNLINTLKQRNLWLRCLVFNIGSQFVDSHLRAVFANNDKKRAKTFQTLNSAKDVRSLAKELLLGYRFLTVEHIKEYLNCTTNGIAQLGKPIQVQTKYSSQNAIEVKIAVCGFTSTGKSAITIQYVANQIIDTYDSTIEDSYRKATTRWNEAMVLEILDTAGLPEYASLRTEYMKNAEGFLVVFSYDKLTTLTIGVEEFVEQIVKIRDMSASNIPIVLVGNKNDLPDHEKEVQQSDIDAIVAKYGLTFVSTNCKDSAQVRQTFGLVTEYVLKDKAYKFLKSHGRRLMTTTSNNTNNASIAQSQQQQQLQRNGKKNCLVQ